MGFGYYPDGVYGCIRGQPCEGTELEAEVVPPSGGAPGCNTAKNCQYPLYYGGETGNDLLGLEGYEPQFDYPTAFWTKSLYSVILTVTDTKTAEIFYFCHIHNYMSGRVIIVNVDGSKRAKLPYQKWNLYTLAPLNDNDKKCGYSPAPMCVFVCVCVCVCVYVCVCVCG